MTNRKFMIYVLLLCSNNVLPCYEKIGGPAEINFLIHHPQIVVMLYSGQSKRQKCYIACYVNFVCSLSLLWLQPAVWLLDLAIAPAILYWTCGFHVCFLPWALQLYNMPVLNNNGSSMAMTVHNSFSPEWYKEKMKTLQSFIKLNSFNIKDLLFSDSFLCFWH